LGTQEYNSKKVIACVVKILYNYYRSIEPGTVVTKKKREERGGAILCELSYYAGTT
jgi:hypothetical protein